MSGFVGSRARKKRRNIFYIFVFILITVSLFLFFPRLENINREIIPNDNIIPDPSEELTSLASNIEELQLNLFQKDQKIKFRDGQIKNLQTKLKETKSQFDSVVLELTEIKNDLNSLSATNQNLVSLDRFKSLQNKFNLLKNENDENISKIKNLTKQIEELNNNRQFLDNEMSDKIKENQKLKKDNKNSFATNIKLEDTISELKQKLNEQKIEIESYIEKINKLKDKSHHGS